MKYKTEQIVVFSRHNVRAPLIEKGSIADTMTPHKWIDWGVNAGELTAHGAELELRMGLYFERYLEAKGFLTKNWQPAKGEVRFRSNSRQRTIATARCFATGFLPAADVIIEHAGEVDTDDALFLPEFPVEKPAFQRMLLEELGSKCPGGDEGLDGMSRHLSKSYRCLEQVLDMADSEAGKSGKKHFSETGSKYVFKNHNVYMEGPFEDAHLLADAIIMQYYEAKGTAEASFGKNLSEEEWKLLAKLVDVCLLGLFGSRKIASLLSLDMLKEMQNEFHQENRKFTFICGHDTNLIALLSALCVDMPEFPDTLVCFTPIGMKLLLEKLCGEDGREYAALQLSYAGISQICGDEPLDYAHPPVHIPLTISGLNKNEDGYYLFSELEDCMNEAMNLADRLYREA